MDGAGAVNRAGYATRKFSPGTFESARSDERGRIQEGAMLLQGFIEEECPTHKTIWLATWACEVPHWRVWLESLPQIPPHRLIAYGLAFRLPAQGPPKSRFEVNIS